MTTEQVESAFNKAVELTASAAQKLPEGCVGQGLIQSLFVYLCNAAEDAPREAQLKEAA